MQDLNDISEGRTARNMISFDGGGMHQQQQQQQQSTDDNDLTSLLLPSSPPQATTNTTSTSTTTSPHHIPFIQRQHSTSFRSAIRRLGNYLAYFTLIGMLIFVPLVLYRALKDKKVDLAAYNSAWIMVCGTIILSVRLVYLHLTHWYMPEVQKYVVRILWMVPLYAMQSYLSLRFHRARIYIDTIRDFYEAYVIASFVYYLMELIGGQESLVLILRRKDPRLSRHAFPMSLILQPWELGLEFALQCKHGVLQYVVIKSMTTVMTFICESAGIYGEGKFEWLYAYPYICFLQNLSVMYALYCLVMLYHAIEAELRHPIDWHPLGKFLCVKGIVFFCWWQSVIIYYLKEDGIIENLGSWTSEEVANGLIDYCVVIEMVFFAIAHSYTFTYKDYLPSNLPPEAAPALGMTGGSGSSHHHDHDEGNDETQSSYRPPATLPHPMKFKDAFWSSTVPKETIKDIKRLRTGVDGAINESNNIEPPSISMQKFSSSRTTTSSSEGTIMPEQMFV